jgi:multidrug efflux pump subunit AcrB
MWIVRLALRRPYTFVVMSALIVILGIGSIFTMPTDIFPNIDIPVVSVIWSYGGVSPDEMAKRITTICERAMTTTVNDIEHIESQSYNGVAVVKVFFQPKVKVELAISQITAIVQTILRVLPPGIFPPGIIKYNASSVPILQIGLNSKTLTEQQIYDFGLNFIRTQLATVQGASVPLPYGGKARQIMVDLNPEAMYANHLSATDVSNAINAQNLILPAGTAKIGDREYLVRLNSSPQLVDEMNSLPIRTSGGATVYIKDVAHVRDGYAVQQNIVRQDGGRSALLTVLKNGNASTLEIIDKVKARLPKILETIPGLTATQLFDQSIFVRAAISGVLREGAIAAALTGFMILLFLGSWRSTVIVCVSIPLSILTSLMILSIFGETINVMTLGGLSLAVGILVDDATVEIENVHRNMAQRKPLTRAILDGAQQIAVPAFVSTLAICIVFVPVLLLTGAARYLFTPLAMAVVFAMLTSYLLSRTLVPTMVHYLLRAEIGMYTSGEHEKEHAGESIIWRVHHRFNHLFEKIRNRYNGALAWSLHRRALVSLVFTVFCLGSLALGLLVGQDFFPYIDSGQMRLHVRAQQGTRIEETERIFSEVEDEIRHVIPPHDLAHILDNIGLPPGGINLAFSDSASIGNGDGEILIALKPDRQGKTPEYQQQLRERLRARFPAETFFFQAANITNQILNFGLPAPIDVQIVTRDADGGYKLAKQLERKISLVPGAVDVHVHQEVAYPEFHVNVDRIKANQVGLTQRDVANSLLISLSSSGQVAPNQWLNPVNGVNYNVSVQTPTYRNNSFDALRRTPISNLAGSSTELLSNLATFGRGSSVAIVDHYNVQPVFDVFANVERRDLGGVSNDVNKILSEATKHLPRGTTIDVRGQVTTMRESFIRLGIGLLFAILLVYLLMVVNFQSWLDPFIILMALPGAMAGIVWMLFITQTTFNVPSLMGAIMCIGVATANSILMVTFANDERATGMDSMQAALSAGYTRIRPVSMTALAMIFGMLPMALGMGEGGEQNAPLGRAVIGGLLVATFATLFIVPIAYSVLRKKPPLDQDRQIEDESHETIPGMPEPQHV